ncbi:putative Dormancy/auxin associated family protein [Tripterygium wilfordii]|uniref:Putative Dormancy/auxin associated family protein n=1 Tax=Tripterygium wilfordii TaxID=458696 RepID=A0A7J7DC15_TRIWF|nr:dormancy-associated protein homolog 4-like isoform X2 [Tripterygium wilfordii]KAF5743809.1 putative Dormancy/auxin associated family protein [Tripterygium wilfordii]
MGFLHKLWDETLAGPAPDTGLGKLRKYDSFKLPPSSTATTTSPPSHHRDHNHIAVTRSISIIRTTSNLAVDPGSPPDSPAGSAATPTTPMSPGTPRADFKRLMRRKSPAEALESAESRSPIIYDWIVMSALDC